MVLWGNQSTFDEGTCYSGATRAPLTRSIKQSVSHAGDSERRDYLCTCYLQSVFERAMMLM